MFNQIVDSIPMKPNFEYIEIVEHWWQTGIAPTEYATTLNKSVYRSNKPNIAQCQKRLLAMALERQDSPKIEPVIAYNPKLDELQKKQYALQFLNMGQVYSNAYTGACREDTIAMQGLRDWQASDKPFILLCGKTGTGKTFAGLVGMTDAMSQFTTSNTWDGLCVRDHQLSEMVALSMTNASQRVELYNKKNLMLDDLRHGAKITEAFQTFVFNIISERFNHQRTTIITTNATAGQFFTAYGDQVRRRILEAGKIVELI